MPRGSINCNPKHWRARAKEARALAESLRDAQSRRMMLQVADDYEKLAARAERRGRPQQGKPAGRPSAPPIAMLAT